MTPVHCSPPSYGIGGAFSFWRGSWRSGKQRCGVPAQTAAWERADPRLRVIRRELKYRGWPEHPPREKGVDVALAIALVESALLNEYDVAIVFSSDTDLIPVVEMAFHRTTPNIEIAAWSGAKPLWFPTEMAAGRRLPWCHFLGERDVDAVRDLAIYIPKP